MPKVFGPYPGNHSRGFEVANHYKFLGYKTRVNLAKGTVTVSDEKKPYSGPLTGKRITAHMNEYDYQKKYGKMFRDD